LETHEFNSEEKGGIVVREAWVSEEEIKEKEWIKG
jgi:hypothetical protein